MTAIIDNPPARTAADLVVHFDRVTRRLWRRHGGEWPVVRHGPRADGGAAGPPNGAGKTTAIEMLLGLIRPDAGAVDLFGGPPADAVANGRVGAML